MRLQSSMIRLLRLGDIFSLLNLSFGLISMIFIMRGEPWFALSFILLSALSDGADGILARKFGSGKLGENLDSLADLSSFSISPSLLAYSSFQTIYLLPFLLVYVVCSAVRLSSFHIFKKEVWFVGLPTPAAGILLATSCMVVKDYLYISVILIVLSMIMISRIPYPKPDKVIGSAALVLIFMCLIFGKVFDMIFVKILLLSSLFYVLLGPLYVKMLKMR